MLRPPSHSSFPRTSFCFNDNVIEWSVNHVDVNRTPISTHQSFESFDSDLNDEWDAGGPLPQQLGATKYKFYRPDQKFPTGVETILMRCYSPSCDGPGCY